MSLKPDKKKLSVLAWYPTILVFFAVLWLTLAPRPIGDSNISLFKGADKCIHAIMFAALALSFLRDRLRVCKINVTPASAIVVTLAVSALGILIEILQDMMALGRSFEWGDIVADCIGAMIGAASALLFLKRPVNEHNS